MCDLSQFVVACVTNDITAVSLADLYMSEVLLKYGMTAVVVIDDGNTFKGVFAQMCSILNITLWTLSKGNHKGLSVERFHRFLNKTQTIAGHSVGTHAVFSRNVRLSAYAWNSAPIDGTDIIHSFVAVGHEFRFPLDLQFANAPPLNLENKELFEYLQQMGQESQFATQTLQILIEDRREAHRNRVNASKSTSCHLKIGNIIKAHVQVQSNFEKGEVKKLSYSARGPFTIVEDLGHGSFLVQPYGKPDAAKRKYKSTELYLLPPAIFPSTPLDTVDQRYLNYEHAPVLSPFAKSLNIEEYNTQWFNDTLPSNQPFTMQTDKKSPESSSNNKLSTNNTSPTNFTPSFPSIESMHQETKTTNDATIDQNPIPSSELVNLNLIELGFSTCLLRVSWIWRSYSFPISTISLAGIRLS